MLLAGGFKSLAGLLPLGNKDIEVFDPKTETFSVVATLPTMRGIHTATLLPDGRVIFIGGSPSTVVEAFDPKTNTVSRIGRIIKARREHAATLLDNGKILITGGIEVYLRYRNGQFERKIRVVRLSEVFDPKTGTSEELKTRIAVSRRGHTQTLLADGNVLITGGTGGDRWGSCLLLKPGSGDIRIIGRLRTPREDHRATGLADGRLFISGGTAHGRSVKTCEFYDPAEAKFVAIKGLMSAAREDHTATLLADGRVLLTGGEDNQAGPDKADVVLSSAELFDVKRDAFVKQDGLRTGRDDHRATRLKDGRVFIFGGQTDSGEVLNTGELFIP